MKIQGTLSGIKIDIECPEIVHQDGKWWEPVEFRLAVKGEKIFFENKLQEAHVNFERLPLTIYREIPEPTKEWLLANGMQKSETPKMVAAGDVVWTQHRGTEEINMFAASESLAGKYRFHLYDAPQKTTDEQAREYAQAFLKNEITAGQLLTKLEGMK